MILIKPIGFQNLLYQINSEIDEGRHMNIETQMDKINGINLQTKIELNSNYIQFNFLGLKDDSFIIYNKKEILLFNKNLSYKKIFPSNNNENEKINIYIKSMKYFNKVKFLFIIIIFYIYLLLNQKD